VQTSITELNAIEAEWQGRWRRAGYRGSLRAVLEDALAVDEST
jgi:hypothetical protein